MKNVKFPVVYSLPNNSGVIVYPDAIEKFSDVQVIGGDIYAKYSGDLSLDESAPPYFGSWHISKLSFRSRFTRNERIAIEMAAAANTAQGAAMRADLADQRDARYIDLKRADTRAGVQALEAGGLLAAGRAAIILDTPPTADELFS